MNPTTPEERRAYAARKLTQWRTSAAAQAYQRKLRERLFNPDWDLRPDRKKWRVKDDVSILARLKSDRELAKRFRVTIPALRQRRIRVRRLLLSAAGHAEIAAAQIAYHRKLSRALKKYAVTL